LFFRYIKQVIHTLERKRRINPIGSHSENVNTSEITGPLLATREAALADSVLATTLALGIDLDVVPDREELRRRWRTASLRLVGTDMASRAATLGAVPGVWVVGFDSEELLQASAELGAPALLLPGESQRLAEVSRLVAREDVDYVSVKVSAVTGPHNPWGFDEVVAHGVDVLSPLYRLARDHGTFLNLDMEDYKDLDLTIAVFTAILDQEDLTDYEAGIVLQAYLPDSLAAMERLQEWATARVDSGGSRIKVRVVKGANLSMERVDAQIHGWELTTWPTKQATDTNYKRILSWAMTPERTRAIRLGVAGQNLFDIAFAYELRAARGVADDVEFEMLAGMATGLQEVVRHDTGHLLLYVPVVDPDEFDVAISYLVRRLEENAAPDNFMSGVFDLASDATVFAREEGRFLAALAEQAQALVFVKLKRQ